MKNELRRTLSIGIGPFALTLAIITASALLAAACATTPTASVPQTSAAGSGATSVAPPSELNMSSAAPSPDPRVGLRAGQWDTVAGVITTPAAEAGWNMRLISNTATPAPFNSATNSDLAFSGQYAYQGNYNGYMVWDISTPSRPTLAHSYVCPASQSDVSVYKHLLFVSGESQAARNDCGIEGVTGAVSPDRFRGIRIIDVSDAWRPKYITNVQTCRGSHTHTVVSDARDRDNVYIYVSGSSGVRPAEELAGCSGGTPEANPATAEFRIEVIRVPLRNPARAAIVSSPRIFTGLTAPPPSAAQTSINATGGGGRSGGVRGGPSQCHDITVYPAVGLAGGACGGYGLLLDISTVTNPLRIDQAADSNMSFWHSATFSNDGSKVLFSDEWGGGSQPRCRQSDSLSWGANALFTIENRKMVFRSYYKMPAAQTEQENCVAHNGSLIPIPGRDVMVQAFYQGGITVFDWTDATRPYEIAFHDRGPIAADRRVSGGSWSVYWYNGLIVSSEIERGLDIYELVPSAHITQNEIDAAKTVRYEQLNAQEQPKMVWPPSFAMVRAFTDQLQRSGGLPAARLGTLRGELAAAESMSGGRRRAALQTLATRLDAEAAASSDSDKVRLLAAAVRDLAR